MYVGVYFERKYYGIPSWTKLHVSVAQICTRARRDVLFTLTQLLQYIYIYI